MRVKDLENREDLVFVNVDFEVRELLDLLGVKEDYNALFVKMENGDIVEAYGMYGVVPDLEKPVFRIR